MAGQIAIGMITPSINKALEPVSYRMLAGHPEISLHFSRVRVTRVGIDDDAMAALDIEGFMHSAALLKDAGVDVIMWNGTSGSWAGIEWERTLCRRIQEATGIPASGSTLAILNALAHLGATRYGLAVPYDSEHMHRIVEVYRKQGLTCAACDTLDFPDGLKLPDLPRATLEDQIRRVAVADAQAVAIVCTNMATAPYVEPLEAELGIPIVDSVAATLWEALRLCGSDHRIDGWGRLMRSEGRAHAH